MNNSTAFLDWMDDFILEFAMMRMDAERLEECKANPEVEFTDEEYVTFLPNELLIELIKNGCDDAGEPVGQYAIDLASTELESRIEILGMMAMGFDEACEKKGVMS